MSTESMLDKLDRGQTPSDPELTKALVRLVNGQRWLVDTWHRARDQEQWEDVDLFWRSYNAWDRLEIETRARWMLKTCVIGPGGCEEDAPIRCDYCVGAIPFKVMVCTRDSRSGYPAKSTKSSKVEDGDRTRTRKPDIEGDGGKQGALIEGGNAYH